MMWADLSVDDLAVQTVGSKEIPMAGQRVGWKAVKKAGQWVLLLADNWVEQMAVSTVALTAGR